MTRTITLLAITFLALAGCRGKDKDKDAPPPRAGIVDVEKDDAAMNQAIAEARAQLEVFDERLALRQPGQEFSVKKPFAWGTSAEHMWLVDVKAVEGGFEGRLDNQPRDARDAKVGERYQVTRAELSDWLITQDGKLSGGYTLRVMLPGMGPEERARFSAALAPLPTEADLRAAREAAAARAPGKAAIGQLKQRLVGALTAALARGVPEAIAVCSREAPAIAASLAVDGVTVGRATRKPRQPGNAATGWQADALSHFEALVAAGSSLEGAAFTTRLPDGRTAYAEPLLIQPLCLSCHGATLAPEVSAALAAKYPADQATGYALGELRGVAWAELAPAPAPR